MLKSEDIHAIMSALASSCIINKQPIRSNKIVVLHNHWQILKLTVWLFLINIYSSLLK